MEVKIGRIEIIKIMCAKIKMFSNLFLTPQQSLLSETEI